MDDHAYASLPDSFIVVGVLAGFHDEGRRVARSIRGRLLSRLVSRAALGEHFLKHTLAEDAALVLQDEPRHHDILLSSCIVVWKGDQVSILAAGNYDVWCAQASGLSQILAGSSVYQQATSSGVEVERQFKNYCTAALCVDSQKSVIQQAEMTFSPTDTLVVTVGDVEPESVLRRVRAVGRGSVVFAVDQGEELRLSATLCFRK